MSDIQELIHRTTMIAYEQGVKDTEERLVKLIKSEKLEITPGNPRAGYDLLVFEGIKEQLIELLQGEQK